MGAVDLTHTDTKAPTENRMLESVFMAAFAMSIRKADPDIEKRYVDRAIVSIIQDATNGKEPVQVVNKRLFRPDEPVPLVDTIRINKPFVIRLLANKT